MHRVLGDTRKQRRQERKVCKAVGYDILRWYRVVAWQCPNLKSALKQSK